MINEKRLLDQFLELIQIDSESRNERAMGEKLVEILKGMGLKVWTDEPGGTYPESNGFNVYAKLDGTMEGEPYILSAHMDTVVPGNGIKPIIKDGVISTDGSTILAGDDKSGIVGILEAVQTILEKGLPHRAAEIAFSVGEEIGMRGAKAMDMSKFESKRAYVFDGGGKVGRIEVGAPGQIKINAWVIGRSAHAGLAPEEGISSIQVAAKGIAKMNLLRIDEETTCNIGTIRAEYTTNIVPEKTYIWGEVRSRNYDKLLKQTDHIVKCLQDACDEGGARLELDNQTNYVSYLVPEDSLTVKYVKEAVERMGLTPEIGLGGGGSDANIFNRNGIEALVLSTGMSKVHTVNESIAIDELNKTAELCLELLTH